MECAVADDVGQLAAGLDKADVLILGDLHRRAFDEAPGTLERLCANVQEGLPLLYHGGWESFGAGGYIGTRLEPLLPVRMLKDDIRFFPHQTRGVCAVEPSRRLGRDLDFANFPLSTSYNLVQPSPGAETILAKKVGAPREERDIPLAVFRDGDGVRCLCIAMSLVGGGAKDLAVWEQFPLFLALAVGDLAGIELVAKPDAGYTFRALLNEFRRADFGDKERVVQNYMKAPWAEDHRPAQLQFLGDLAGLIRSELAATSRILMLPFLFGTPAYRVREVEIYKYQARAAANRFEFLEAAALYTVAAVKQQASEAAAAGRALTWSPYFHGMSHFCSALHLVTVHPLDPNAALRECTEAIQELNFYPDEKNHSVPEHKRQIIWLAEAVREVLQAHDEWRRMGTRLREWFRLPPARRLERARLAGLVEKLQVFATTYDELPVLRDERWVAELSRMVRARASAKRWRRARVSAEIHALHRFYHGPAEWKPRFVEALTYAVDDALGQTKPLRLLERVTPVLRVVAAVFLVMYLVLQTDQSRAWISTASPELFRTASVLIGGLAGAMVAVGSASAWMRKLRGRSGPQPRPREITDREGRR